MAEVRPFRGVRFNEEKIGSYSRVITPPFDVITPPMRTTLGQQSPFSMVHLILPRSEEDLDPYEGAGRRFNAWNREGILQQDREDSFYLLEQEFQGLDGKSHTRRGFFALVKLPEPGERKTVLDHERTFDHKVEDRLRLTEATRANLGAVLLLYEDKKGELNGFLAQMDQRPADMAARTIDGVNQRVWRVPADERITAFFHDKTLYIADGHHRFRTAVTYRDLMRAREHTATPKEYDYVLVALVEFNDPGLVIWPTHRLVDPPDGFEPERFIQKLEEWFEVKPLDGALDESAFAERIESGQGCTIGMAIHSRGRFLLTLKGNDRTAVLGQACDPVWRELDVAVLHRGVFEQILGLPPGAELTYEADAKAALSLVDSGEKKLAFLLKAIRPEHVRACADAGVYMPEKATYFFPKIPSGAVIHVLY